MLTSTSFSSDTCSAERDNNYRREPRCTSRRATIITELFRPPRRRGAPKLRRRAGSVSPFLSLSLGLSLSFVSLVLVISFSFSRLSLSLSLLLPDALLSARIRGRVYAWAVRACACPRRVRRVVVPKEPRASTFPSWKVLLLVGQKQRPPSQWSSSSTSR